MYPLHFAVTSLFALLLLGQAAHAAPVITKQALQQDIDLVLRTVREQHPDLGFSTSDAAVTAALAAIGRDLPPSMTRDEAWRQLARINPLLADGHLAITLTDWRADTAAHRAAGGVLFPFDVAFDPQGRLVIDAALGGAASPLAGARIVAIDGVPVDTLVASLASRVHGDTPAMRMALLAQRWWLYH